MRSSPRKPTGSQSLHPSPAKKAPAFSRSKTPANELMPPVDSSSKVKAIQLKGFSNRPFVYLVEDTGPLSLMVKGSASQTCKPPTTYK